MSAHATVAIRSGGTTGASPAIVYLSGGALMIHLHIQPGELADSIDRTRRYGFTVYGDDLAPVITVDDIAIVGPPVWPPGCSLLLNQRIDIGQDPIVHPTTAHLDAP